MHRVATHIFVALIPIVTFSFGLLLLAGSPPEDVFEHEYSEPELVKDFTFSATGTVKARSWYVFDLASNQVLLSNREDELLPIASITKLFSTALFNKYATTSSEVLLTNSDANVLGITGNLNAGDRLNMRELSILSLLVSSNVAATAQARLYPYDLIEAMNRYTAGAGLSASEVVFTDTSGLSSGNRATARALGNLLSYLYHQDPYVLEVTRLRQYMNESKGWKNNSPFIEESGYLGGKHGYTPEAGRTAVVLFEESVANGPDRVIGYVVLGSNDVHKDVTSLRALVRASVRYE